MTTQELAKSDAPPAPLTVVPMNQISMFPSEPELNMIIRLATMAVEAGQDFVPKSVKTKAQAIAIILAGREVGLKPISALRHIYVVNGKTDIETRGMMGICIANDPNIRFETTEYTKEAVTIVMHRPGVLKQPLTVRYTVEDAKASGQYKPGPWVQYTRDMLFAAAGKRCCRIGAPDLLNGIDAGMQTVNDAEAIEAQVRVVEPTPEALSNGAAELPADAFNEGDDGPLSPEVEAPDPKILQRQILEDVKRAHAEWNKPDFEAWRDKIKADFPDAFDSAGKPRFPELPAETIEALAKRVRADVGAPVGQEAMAL